MISRITLLSSCLVLAASLLIGKSDAFSSVAPTNTHRGQQQQLQTQDTVLFSTVEDYDAVKEKKKRVSASPLSTFGKANADEFLAKPTGIESEFPKRKIKASVRETGTDSMKYYIKSMCNHELLNKNEEIILAREIQILLKWEKEREKLEEELLR